MKTRNVFTSILMIMSTSMFAQDKYNKISNEFKELEDLNNKFIKYEKLKTIIAIEEKELEEYIILHPATEQNNTAVSILNTSLSEKKNNLKKIVLSMICLQIAQWIRCFIHIRQHYQVQEFRMEQ